MHLLPHPPFPTCHPREGGDPARLSHLAPRLRGGDSVPPAPALSRGPDRTLRATSEVPDQARDAM